MRKVILSLIFLAGLAAQAQTVVPMPERDIIKLAPDYTRPLVYALNSRAGVAAGSTLMALDAATGEIRNELLLGLTPTDFDIDPSGRYLFVVHFGNNTIWRVDLENFTVADTRTFAPPQNHGQGNHYNIQAVTPGIVYYTDGAWGPILHRYNYTTGAEIDIKGLWGEYGVGGMVTTQDGQKMYGWAQYGWSAGIGSSYVAKVDIGNNRYELLGQTSNVGRDPLDAPIFLNANESLVFHKGGVFTTADMRVKSSFTQVVRAIPLHGELAVGESKVFATETAETLATFATVSTVATFSGDQSNLLRFVAGSRTLEIIPVSTFATITGAEMVPTPPDGGAVNLPLAELSWTAAPGALAYHVYFGGNAAEVEAATAESPLRIGRVTQPRIAGPTLQAGQSYYWRVDIEGFGGQTIKGAVWNFDASSVVVTPAAVSISAIRGVSPADLTLTITSAVAGSAWAIVEDVPWLSVEPASGVAPGQAVVRFATENLAAGTHSAQIGVTSNGRTAPVAIQLQVLALNLSKMETDFARPYIYAIQAPPAAERPASIVVISTATDRIVKVIPVGLRATDFAIHYPERKMYVTDHGSPRTFVIDLNTLSLLPNVNFGADAFKINAGKQGRVVIEGLDQWIDMGIYDTATGARIRGLNMREGDGEASPDGEIYYHVDNNISNAAIHKFRAGDDSLTGLRAGPSHPYGSRNLIISRDGSRLIWRGYVMDGDLNESANLGEEIYALSANGQLAFGGANVLDTRDSRRIHTRPYTTGVKALSSDQTKLYEWDPASGNLIVTPMQVVLSPTIADHPADRTAIVGETIALNGSATGIQPITYQWQFNGGNISGGTLPTLNLTRVTLAAEGEYTLIATNPHGSVTSRVARVTVMEPPGVRIDPAFVDVRAGTTVTLEAIATGTAPLTFSWEFEGRPIPDATGPTLTIPNAQQSAAGFYRVTARNAVGAATSPAALVRINPSSPIIVNGPAGRSVAAGSAVELSVQAVGSAPMAYEWRRNDQPIPGATGPTLSISNAQAAQAGVYTVRISNSAGFALSNPATLEVLPAAPVIVLQPADSAVRSGSEVALTVSARGTEPMVFRWMRGETEVQADARPSLTFAAVRPEDAGSYHVIVENSAGQATSNPARLSVEFAPAVTGLQRIVAAPGDDVVLTASVTGTEPIAGQWTFRGREIAGATTRTLSLQGVARKDWGAYTFTASNRHGSSSATATLVVQIAPGAVVAWGDNSAGQATGPAIANAVEVTGGALHSVAVQSDGSVAAWGDNYYGQATPPAGLANVISVAAGSWHSLALKEDGGVVAWGNNSFGQLNVPANLRAAVAIAAGDVFSAALQADGQIRVWGDTSGLGNLGAANAGLADLAGTQIHLLALRGDGAVVGWGNNSFGQITPPPGSMFRAVAGGYLHSLGINAAGQLVGWGDRTFEQYPLAGPSGITQVAAGEIHSLALGADGRVHAWGDNRFGQATVPAAVPSALAIGAGHYHSLAIVRAADPLRVSARDGNTLTLTWGTGARLQKSDAVDGSYTTLDVEPPYVVDLRQETKAFFKIIPR